MQNRDRPRPRRTLRPAPERSPTASSCSSRSSRSPNTADRRIFQLAPYLAIMPAFLAFAIVPIGGVVTIAGPQDVPAARRSAVRDPVAARDVGPRPLRRDARGLVVGLEVPAARLGARLGAAPQLRGRVRARDRRRAVQSNTLSTRGIVDPAGLGRRAVDLQRRLVLAAGDRRARDLRASPRSPRRTTRRSTSSRPSRSSPAGSSPSTPASASRSSTSPSS